MCSPEEASNAQKTSSPANMFSTIRAFPDARFALEDQIAEGDTVVSRWTARGTHRGEFLGIAPSGEEVTVYRRMGAGLGMALLLAYPGSIWIKDRVTKHIGTGDIPE